MTAQELKNSILQYAVQGKLVPQDPNDEPASELLKRIQAEKQLLIKDKKIKIENTLVPITDIDKPFDIPESWEWCKLQDISLNIHYGYTASSQENGNSRLLRITDIQNNFVRWNDVPYCNVTSKEYVSYGLNNRDIMIARTGGTIGKTYIVRNLEEKSVFASYLIRVIPSIEVNEEYLKFFLESPFYWSQLKDKSMGTGQPNVNGMSLKNLILCLPPLSEQQRIVDKIEELMPLVEEYGKAEAELKELNKAFPEQIKKSILQYAIQGKLVPQNPQDEPASVLLDKINAEKQRLIHAKIIKAQKPLFPIIMEEIPFEIPDSWVWVRLGDIVTIKSSKRVFEKDYVSTGVPFYRSKEIGILSKKGEPETNLYISKALFSSIKASYGVPSIGDLLITSVGSIGNTWIVDERDFYFKDGNITQIVKNEYIYIPYIEHFIKSQLFTKQISDSVAGTVYTALTIIKFNSLLFPLPPLSEQKLIVEKVEEVLSYCDKLK